MFMNSRKVRVPAKDMTFVISQFRASDRKQQEFNKDFAKALAWHIYKRGEFPVLPHLYFPRFLGDEGEEREWGIQAGHRLMALCSKAVAASIDGHVSEGMQKDIEAASALKLFPETMIFTAESAEEFINRFKESRA